MPAYLTLLNDAWAACDRPSSRVLAEATGLSHTTIAETLSGKIKPSKVVMRKIAEALTLDPADADEIVSAYEAMVGKPVRAATSGPREGDVARAIREGLHEIAEAIRSLKD